MNYHEYILTEILPAALKPINLSRNEKLQGNDKVSKEQFQKYLDGNKEADAMFLQKIRGQKEKEYDPNYQILSDDVFWEVENNDSPNALPSISVPKSAWSSIKKVIKNLPDDERMALESLKVKFKD